MSDRERCVNCGLALAIDHPDIHEDGHVECPPAFNGIATPTVDPGERHTP